MHFLSSKFNYGILDPYKDATKLLIKVDRGIIVPQIITEKQVLKNVIA